MRKTAQEIHFPGSPSPSLMTCPAHRVNMGSYKASHDTLSACGGLKVVTRSQKWVLLVAFILNNLMSFRVLPARSKGALSSQISRATFLSNTFTFLADLDKVPYHICPLNKNPGNLTVRTRLNVTYRVTYRDRLAVSSCFHTILCYTLYLTDKYEGGISLLI